MNMISNKYICPVCGYAELNNPAWDDDLNPSWDICPSCGTHFGYYDFGTIKEEIALRHNILRKAWIDKGRPWHSTSQMQPPDWNPSEQIKNISQ
jgi:hypothetical protein